MNVKKIAILGAFLTACSLPTMARDSVELIINGQINPITCSLQGGNRREITMVPKDISLFTSVNTEVDGGQTASITLRCPNTTAVDLSVADTFAIAGRTFDFLVGKDSNNNNQTEFARRIGVRLVFFNGSTEIPAVSRKNMGTTNRLFNSSGNDYVTLADRTVTIRPYYYQYGANITPGKVRAEATLTFTYP